CAGRRHPGRRAPRALRRRHPLRRRRRRRPRRRVAPPRARGALAGVGGAPAPAGGPALLAARRRRPPRAAPPRAGPPGPGRAPPARAARRVGVSGGPERPRGGGSRAPLTLPPSSRRTNLARCSAQFLEQRFGDPHRLAAAPPVETLRPAVPLYSGGVSFYLI